MTREECMAKAAEAEQLANLVSLGTDKEKLRRSAQQWRERANGAGPARGRVNMGAEFDRASAR
jgi:hypothetical protein